MITIMANVNEFDQCARHSLKPFNPGKDTAVLNMPI